MEKALLNKIILCLENTLLKTKNPVVAFDADGTLWPYDVGKKFFQYQVKNRLIKKVSDPKATFNNIQAGEGKKQALIWLAKAQAGFSLSQLNLWVKDFLSENVFKMFSFQQSLIKWLRAQKVEVFVVSSSLKWVLDQALKDYDILPQNIIGVQTKVQNGIITDQPILPAPIYRDKVLAFQAHTQGACPFLVAGNTLADQALLEFSSHWRLVVATANEGEKNYESERKLLSMAIDKGWFYYDGLK